MPPSRAKGGAWSAKAIAEESIRPPVFPFGEDGRGLLVYTDAGQVSAILSRGERDLLGVPSLERAGQASEEAQAALRERFGTG